MGLKILIGIILALIFPFLDYFLLSLGMGLITVSLGIYMMEYSGDRVVMFTIVGLSLIFLDVAFQLFLGTFFGLFLLGLILYYLIDAIIHLNTWWKRNLTYFFLFFVIYYLLGFIFTYSKISLDKFLSFDITVLLAAFKNALFGSVWLLIIKTIEAVLFGGDSKSIKVY